MKKTLLILLCASLLLSLCACASLQQKECTGEDKLNIVTTVFPAYDFARAVAGDLAHVTLLVPPGSEVHSYEPAPSDILRLEGCDILVCAGGEGEAWLEQILDGTEQDFVVICMLDCVDALEEEIKEGMQKIHEEETEEEGPEYDEHVWASPCNAIRISEKICETLCLIDEIHVGQYRTACESYCEELTALDAAFRETVEGGKFRTLVFADRFPVRYFTEEYGLDYFAAFPGCADDTEPSAKTVAFLIDTVRKQALPAVFTIEFSNEKMADIICEDTGCKKLLFHSCHNVSARELEEGVTYLQLMWKNVENLKEALD